MSSEDVQKDIAISLVSAYNSGWRAKIMEINTQSPPTEQDIPRACLGEVLPKKAGSRNRRSLSIPAGILKKAGLRTGARLKVELQDDGSIVIRRLSARQPAGTAEDQLFEKCAQEVLSNRRELLERLAR